MFQLAHKGKSLSFRCLASVITVCFLSNLLFPAQVLAQTPADLGLPQPGTMISLSPKYTPVMMKGLRIHPENPVLFDFIVDTGNSGIKTDGARLRSESQRLIKYFLASLTIPENDLWVNLSPYEKNRIIPDQLGQTEMGRDMLAQDYILKQLTASMIYPEKDLGREFWNKVYAKSQQLYGTQNIPVNTFNKVWIVADKAKVYVHDNTAFVVKSHLKVMLEEDYLAASKQLPLAPSLEKRGKEAESPLFTKEGIKGSSTLGSEIIREIVLPALETEVNQGHHFANLRQIFNSMILAAWYKKNLKEAFLNRVYSNKAKINGVDVEDKTIKEQIYQEYLKAYKKGVFNYIKEDIQAGSQTASPRKYFSGGINAKQVLSTVSEIRDPFDSDVTMLGDSDSSMFSVTTAAKDALKKRPVITTSVVTFTAIVLAIIVSNKASNNQKEAEAQRQIEQIRSYQVIADQTGKEQIISRKLNPNRKRYEALHDGKWDFYDVLFVRPGEHGRIFSRKEPLDPSTNTSGDKKMASKDGGDRALITIPKPEDFGVKLADAEAWRLATPKQAEIEFAKPTVEERSKGFKYIPSKIGRPDINQLGDGNAIVIDIGGSTFRAEKQQIKGSGKNVEVAVLFQSKPEILETKFKEQLAGSQKIDFFVDRLVKWIQSNPNHNSSVLAISFSFDQKDGRVLEGAKNSKGWNWTDMVDHDLYDEFNQRLEAKEKELGIKLPRVGAVTNDSESTAAFGDGGDIGGTGSNDDFWMEDGSGNYNIENGKQDAKVFYAAEEMNAGTDELDGRVEAIMAGKHMGRLALLKIKKLISGETKLFDGRMNENASRLLLGEYVENQSLESSEITKIATRENESQVQEILRQWGITDPTTKEAQEVWGIAKAIVARSVWLKASQLWGYSQKFKRADRPLDMIVDGALWKVPGYLAAVQALIDQWEPGLMQLRYVDGATQKGTLILAVWRAKQRFDSWLSKKFDMIKMNEVIFSVFPLDTDPLIEEKTLSSAFVAKGWRDIQVGQLSGHERIQKKLNKIEFLSGIIRNQQGQVSDLTDLGGIQNALATNTSAMLYEITIPADEQGGDPIKRIVLHMDKEVIILNVKDKAMNGAGAPKRDRPRPEGSWIAGYKLRKPPIRIAPVSGIRPPQIARGQKLPRDAWSFKGDNALNVNSGREGNRTIPIGAVDGAIWRAFPSGSADVIEAGQLKSALDFNVTRGSEIETILEPVRIADQLTNLAVLEGEVRKADGQYGVYTKDRIMHELRLEHPKPPICYLISWPNVAQKYAVIRLGQEVSIFQLEDKLTEEQFLGRLRFNDYAISRPRQGQPLKLTLLSGESVTIDIVQEDQSWIATINSSILETPIRKSFEGLKERPTFERVINALRRPVMRSIIFDAFPNGSTLKLPVTKLQHHLEESGFTDSSIDGPYSDLEYLHRILYAGSFSNIDLKQANGEIIRLNSVDEAKKAIQPGANLNFYKATTSGGIEMTIIHTGSQVIILDQNDFAMRASHGHTPKEGGINLNARNMQLEEDGQKLDIHFDEAMMARFERGDFSGVTPVILNVTPIFNIRPMLGLAPAKEPEQLAKV